MSVFFQRLSQAVINNTLIREPPKTNGKLDVSATYEVIPANCCGRVLPFSSSQRFSCIGGLNRDKFARHTKGMYSRNCYMQYERTRFNGGYQTFVCGSSSLYLEIQANLVGRTNT